MTLKSDHVLWNLRVLLNVPCAPLMGIQTDSAGHYLSTNTTKCSPVQRMAISVQCGSVWNSSPSAFVVHSEGREDKQVCMYKEITPGLFWVRRHPSIVPKLDQILSRFDQRKLWDTHAVWTLSLFAIQHNIRDIFFFFRSFSMFVKELKRRIMQMPLAHHILAVQLFLFGYCGDVYAGAVLMNSNAIKTLPGAGKGADTVSPSPRTSPPGGMGHKLPSDTLQVN